MYIRGKKNPNIVTQPQFFVFTLSISTLSLHKRQHFFFTASYLDGGGRAAHSRSSPSLNEDSSSHLRALTPSRIHNDSFTSLDGTHTTTLKLSESALLLFHFVHHFFIICVTNTFLIFFFFNFCWSLAHCDFFFFGFPTRNSAKKEDQWGTARQG